MSKCSLINWSNEEQCKRCNNNLHNKTASFPPSTKSDVRKIPLSLYPLFILLYAAGIALAGITTGFLFYVGDRFELIGVTYAIVVTTIGFVLPLAGVHYFIENWKTRITGKPYEVAGNAKNLEIFEQFTEAIPLWIKVIQAVFVVMIAAISAAVSGQFLNNILPSGDYPVLLLGLPSLIAGFLVLIITTQFIRLVRKNK